MPLDNVTGSDTEFRTTLAKLVTVWALAVILVIAVCIVVLAGLDAFFHPAPEKTRDFFEMSKYLLGAILPVVGAWVGTVLAF
jgi:hypothetical protein